MDYEQFRAMNSEIILAAEGAADELTLGFKLTRDFIAVNETRFTRFSETSELAQLNRAAGAWFQASPEMFAVVQEACDLAAETNGLFDPTILEALEAMGYDKSMDDIRMSGVRTDEVRTHALSDSPLGSRGRPREGVSPESRLSQHNQSAFRAILLDEVNQAIHVPFGARIDLGGIAKGWIAEQAALLLSEYTNVCAVSAGGDMFMVGVPADEPSWAIGLEDPLDPDRDLAVLHLGPGAVATSSVVKRQWRQGRHERHHIIDPRTGLPAETDWLSVSVIAPHATLAEVYAKVLLIGGSREAESLAAQRPEITFVAVDQTGQVLGSAQAGEVIENVGIEYV